MLHLPQSVYHQLRRHGEAAYPNECCGVLLGDLSAKVRWIREAIAVDNASRTPRNHYEISPRSLIEVLRQARSIGIEILGFYHSHPDHPAQPSSTDLAEAHWLGCSYLITEVRDGEAAATRAFHLAGSREEDKHFEPEEVAVAPDAPARPVQ